MEAALLILIGGLVGGLGWLYQKACERQERRIERYKSILDNITGYTTEELNREGIRAVQVEVRRLWLDAPDNVVLAGQRFLLDTRGESGKTVKEKQRAMQDFILSMRKDSSFSSAIFPRYLYTKLSSETFQIVTLRKGK